MTDGPNDTRIKVYLGILIFLGLGAFATGTFFVRARREAEKVKARLEAQYGESVKRAGALVADRLRDIGAGAVKPTAPAAAAPGTSAKSDQETKVPGVRQRVEILREIEKLLGSIQAVQQAWGDDPIRNSLTISPTGLEARGGLNPDGLAAINKMYQDSAQPIESRDQRMAHDGGTAAASVELVHHDYTDGLKGTLEIQELARRTERHCLADLAVAKIRQASLTREEGDHANRP